MDETTINSLREVQIQILDSFVQICNEHNLRYCLCAGTCLGAVRHKGYIPWDDDIDVMMPRKDFDKFINISQNSNQTYFLDYYTTDSLYGRNFAKYCKKNTLFIEPNGLRQAIYIDVFAQDKVPSPEYIAQSRVPVMIHKLDAITTVRREGLKGRDFITKMIYWLTRWIPIKWIFNMEKKLMTRFEDLEVKCYLNYGTRYNYIKETIPICEFEPYVQMEFEGKKYNVPRNWDLYLTSLYGDYMTLPPVEKRVTHYPQLISFDITKDDSHN